MDALIGVDVALVDLLASRGLQLTITATYVVEPDANDRYGAFRVGRHDDLVTALGLAVHRAPPRSRFGTVYL
jgi:hypothetical protein